MLHVATTFYKAMWTVQTTLINIHKLPASIMLCVNLYEYVNAHLSWTIRSIKTFADFLP